MDATTVIQQVRVSLTSTDLDPTRRMQDTNSQSAVSRGEFDAAQSEEDRSLGLGHVPNIGLQARLPTLVIPFVEGIGDRLR